MPAPLRGRRALVTGASRGIGRAIAAALAEQGAAVMLSARGEPDLLATRDALRAAGGDVTAHACDVGDDDQVSSLAAAVREKLGGLDILVNNAGFAESAPFHKTSRELWDRTLAVNLTSAFTVTRAFIDGMREQRSGRIVFVASIAGKVGHPYVTAYCAAKHGVIGLTKALALEVAKSGITVNAVCPSYVDTDMTDRSIENIRARTGRSEEQAREAILSQNPQHRLIEPDEVAGAVLYLVSDAARGINGQAINICGGAAPL